MAFSLIDTQLAEEYGVTAKVVCGLCSKELTRLVHWKTVDGAKVYTPEGEKLLRQLLDSASEKKGAADASGAAPVASEPAAGESMAFLSLRILRCYPNARVVRVQLDGPAWVDLKVRDNRKLRPGQLLQCVCRDGKWSCNQRGQSLSNILLCPNTSQPNQSLSSTTPTVQTDSALPSLPGSSLETVPVTSQSSMENPSLTVPWPIPEEVTSTSSTSVIAEAP